MVKGGGAPKMHPDDVSLRVALPLSPEWWSSLFTQAAPNKIKLLKGRTLATFEGLFTLMNFLITILQILFKISLC